MRGTDEEIFAESGRRKKKNGTSHAIHIKYRPPILPGYNKIAKISRYMDYMDCFAQCVKGICCFAAQIWRGFGGWKLFTISTDDRGDWR